MSDDKLQIGIYRIDTDLECFANSKSPIADLCGSVIDEDSRFVPQKTKTRIAPGYKVALLYKLSQQTPRWKSFLSNVVLGGQDVLGEGLSKTESFVLLLARLDSGNLYAVTGGVGYFAIQNVIDDDFGMDIISRLIRKEEKILKAIKEKSVMGGVLGTTKHFRKSYNLYENDSFGKIYQELCARLDTDILVDRFGFSAVDIKRNAACVARSSFRINRAISLDELLRVIDGCEEVMRSLPPISINNVDKIVKKKYSSLIEQLTDHLYEQLWDRYTMDADSVDFDLCHKEFEQYLTASHYVLKKNQSAKNYFGEYEFARLEDIDTLFDKLRTQSESPTSLPDFRKLIESLNIVSFDEEGGERTKGKLCNHVFGDISLEDTKYFLIDNNWYRIKQGFMRELDQSCEAFIKENTLDILDKRWLRESMTENDYNRLYIGEGNTVVLDRITPSYIEPCDVLQWKSNDLYLIHVKDGFCNTMRDLCSQIFIAANRIKNDANSSYEYIQSIWDDLRRKRESNDEYFAAVGRQTDSISRADFVDLFRSKKLIFVLAVRDKTDTNRSIQRMADYRSTIAKFSLQELVKSMKAIEASLRIMQIRE